MGKNEPARRSIGMTFQKGRTGLPSQFPLFEVKPHSHVTHERLGAVFAVGKTPPHLLEASGGRFQVTARLMGQRTLKQRSLGPRPQWIVLNDSIEGLSRRSRLPLPKKGLPRVE